MVVKSVILTPKNITYVISDPLILNQNKQRYANY